MKFTFKTKKPTGKWRSFESTFHYIKLNGCRMGTIDDDEPHTIRLQVIKKDINEDGNPNCEWRWIKLKRECESVNEAKDWLNTHLPVLLEKYQFYLSKN